MANPFTPQFNSSCQWCGETCYANDDIMYALDGDFICESCAEDNNNICKCTVCNDCNKFKKEKFNICYTCNQDCHKEIEF